jgi:hypothetical protein
MVVDEPSLGVPTPLRCSQNQDGHHRRFSNVPAGPPLDYPNWSSIIWVSCEIGYLLVPLNPLDHHQVLMKLPFWAVYPILRHTHLDFCQAVDLGIPPCWKCLPLTSPGQMYLILYTVFHGLPLLQLWRCEVPYNMERIFYYLTGGSSLIVSGKDGGSVQNLGCAIGIGTNFVSFRAILKSVCWWLMVWVVMWCIMCFFPVRGNDVNASFVHRLHSIAIISYLSQIEYSIAQTPGIIDRLCFKINYLYIRTHVWIQPNFPCIC